MWVGAGTWMKRSQKQCPSRGGGGVDENGTCPRSCYVLYFGCVPSFNLASSLIASFCMEL